jgi:hypothetical protein
VQQHKATINAIYKPAQGFHEWRATCVCGLVGPWRISPDAVRRDIDDHHVAMRCVAAPIVIDDGVGV